MLVTDVISDDGVSQEIGNLRETLMALQTDKRSLKKWWGGISPHDEQIADVQADLSHAKAKQIWYQQTINQIIEQCTPLSEPAECCHCGHSGIARRVNDPLSQLRQLTRRGDDLAWRLRRWVDWLRMVGYLVGPLDVDLTPPANEYRAKKQKEQHERSTKFEAAFADIKQKIIDHANKQKDGDGWGWAITESMSLWNIGKDGRTFPKDHEGLSQWIVKLSEQGLLPASYRVTGAAGAFLAKLGVIQ